MAQEPNPTDLTAQGEAKEKTEREHQIRREREIADFKWLMQDERGRRFVWRLMREAGVFHSTFDAEALVMARREGERSQGLKLLNEVLGTCPEKWIEMINDAKRQ